MVPNQEANLVMMSFFQIQTSLKLSHWRTHSYAEHKALDEFLGGFLEKVDEFIEIYQGKYGRFDLKKKSEELTVYQIDKEDIVRYLDCLVGFLVGENAKDCKKFKITPKKDYCGVTVTSILKKEDTDLFNLRDEILGMVNKLKYLLTLK